MMKLKKISFLKNQHSGKNNNKNNKDQIWYENKPKKDESVKKFNCKN
jgi:hypothetical protein